MYLEFRYCFQSRRLKMPFPIHVTVTLEKGIAERALLVVRRHLEVLANCVNFV